jgi:hypothetical protein
VCVNSWIASKHDTNQHPSLCSSRRGSEVEEEEEVCVHWQRCVCAVLLDFVGCVVSVRVAGGPGQAPAGRFCEGSTCGVSSGGNLWGQKDMLVVPAAAGVW